MRINRIKLENIRSYTEQEIEFPLGSVLLSGDIGTGKSTILLAIEFALFGLIKGEVTGSMLLRNGKNSGFVEVDLNIDNRNIIIKRILKRTKTDIKQESGYIIINNVKEDKSPQELKSIVLDLLGYSQEFLTKSKGNIFRYTVFCPQEKMKDIIESDSETRIDILRNVFGFDKYKKIRDNTGIITKKIKDKMLFLKGKTEDVLLLKTELDRLKMSLEEKEKISFQLKDTLRAKQSELSISKSKLEKLEKELKALNEHKTQLSILKSKSIELDNQKNRFHSEVDSLNKDIEKIKTTMEQMEIKVSRSSEEISKQITEKDEYYHRVKTKIMETNSEVRNKRNMLEKLEKESKEINALIKDKVKIEEDLSVASKKIEKEKELELKLDRFQKIIKGLENSLSELLYKINENKNSINELVSFQVCPKCKQNINDGYKREMLEKTNSNIILLEKEKTFIYEQLKAKEQEIDAIKQELNLVRKEREISIELKSRLNFMVHLSMKLNDLEEQKNLLKSELAKEENSLVELGKVNLSVLSNEISSLQLERENIQKQKFLNMSLEEKTESRKKVSETIIEILKKMTLINDEITILAEKIVLYNDTEEEYRKTKVDSDKTALEERKLAIECNTLSTEVQNILIQTKKLKTDLAEKENLIKNLNDLSQLDYWFKELFIPLTFTIEKSVMQRVYIEFNELFKKWFDILADDTLIQARLNDDFSPLIEQNGFETDIVNLSGGEKTALSLAYRLALNKVINEIQSEVKTRDFLILDEPTDGFSDEQLDKVRDVLNELQMNQIIIVSHENKIESYVENVIKINKNDHISNVIPH